MSTVILLSSSPPQIFARSPTPADSSSPLPPTSKLLKNESPSRKRFKTTSAPRDGFTPAFSSARQVLAEREGAQNKMLGSPSRNRFRSSQEDSKVSHEKADIRHEIALPQGAYGSNTQFTTIPEKVAATTNKGPESMIIQITKKDVRRKPKQSNAPLMLQRATSRKIDWTPPKSTTKVDVDTGDMADKITLPTGLLGNFGFRPSVDASNEFSVNPDKPTKRRKLDVTAAPDELLNETASIPEVDQRKAPTTTKKRNKSPTKKSLTITGLATSKFVAPEAEEITPMMQFARLSQSEPIGDLDVDDELNVKAQKLKAVVKKLKGSKKGTVKTRLASPSSAMKSFEDQEAIFGSASQLAGDESPAFLRDTIEAMRQSETNLLSDPASPPCPTQPISIESSTPRLGTSRFRKTRNLWAAADRDENNALLHVETVDLTTMSAVRNAFAGKDVLLQGGIDQSFVTTKVNSVLRGGGSSFVHSGMAACVDIDDIVTPCKNVNAVQTAKLHTSARQQTPSEKAQAKPANEQSLAENVNTLEPQISVAPKQKKKVPQKPHYAGWADHELKKQISAYGFKAIRKREKMIDLLEKCWIEKHGDMHEQEVESNIDKPNTDSAMYGNILSNVHDISARPAPKVKKVKAPRKKKTEDGTATPAKKAKAPRAPRKKKDNGEEVESKPKARKRKLKDVEDDPVMEGATLKPKSGSKSKKSMLSKEIVSDSDEEVGSVNDAAQPPSETVTKNLEVLNTTPTAFVQEPTPPPTLPLGTDQTVYSASKDDNISRLLPTEGSKQSEVSLSTPAGTPPLSEIQKQVTKAIMQQSLLASTSKSSAPTAAPSSQPRRNHQVNPTWHEKILLYDPIILEELALWLNTEGFSNIGEDREISALEVRAWCEERGICCLWKGGWRGNKTASSD